MSNDANNLVNDLLNILQPDTPEQESDKKKAAKPTVKATLVQKKGGKINKPLSTKTEMPAEVEKVMPVRVERIKSDVFLEGIDETIKNTQNAKVVIRKDLYEVFMSIKRAKQVKSVSTLLDHALEDYIKRNSENIKKLLNESKKHGFL